MFKGTSTMNNIFKLQSNIRQITNIVIHRLNILFVVQKVQIVTQQQTTIQQKLNSQKHLQRLHRTMSTKLIC